MKISVIIPVYNEEESISLLLNYLWKNSSKKYLIEFIVVDGGSTDLTCKHTELYPFVTLFYSEKGRAKQMNLGARNSTGEVLYFLHADSFPPKNFDIHIIKKVKQGKLAGCFQMKFNSKHWWLQFMGQFTKINHKTCRGGDQSLFVTRDLFFQLEEFNEDFLIYEDNEFIQKLYKINQFTVIHKWLITSARKYHQIGVWKLQWIHFMIYLKKRFGQNPQQLINYYQKHVKL